MFLLDTHVVSELRKVRLGNADKHVARWADSVDASDLFLSERRDPAQCSGLGLTVTFCRPSLAVCWPSIQPWRSVARDFLCLSFARCETD